VVDLLPPAPSGSVELERPQEVGGIFEVGANSQNLMDKILHTDDAVLSKRVLDNGIGGDRSAVPINLSISPLVYQLSNRLEVRCSPGNVGL